MATKIVTKNSSTASAVPTASDLVQGELAVNVADKRLFTEDNGGSIIELGTNPSTIDINAGSIDGATIGASSASTGAFTTLTATGLTVDTDTLYVDSTNNRVGIGTTSPDADVHISSAGNDAKIILESSANPRGNFIACEGADDLVLAADEDNLGASSAMKFRVDASERMRIDSTGIDVTGTATMDGLTVDGAYTDVKFKTTQGRLDLWLTDTDTTEGQVRVRGDANNLVFITNTAERARLTSDGDLGIGTTAIMQDFGGGRTTLALKGTGTADYSTLQLGNYGTSSNGQIHGLVNFYDGTTSVSRIQSVRASNTSDANLAFYTAPSSGGITERLRIDSSGNVGIGTSSPSKSLHVVGDVLIQDPSPTIEFKDTDNNYIAEISGASGSLLLKADTGGGTSGESMQFHTGGTERMRIDASGNLLVGKSSSSLNTAGVEIDGNTNRIYVTRDSSRPMSLNRLTNDGDILGFFKDGTTVGSIGSYIAYMYIGSTGGVDTHIGFVNGTVRPATATGGLLDNALDLGSSGARWDDIYATNGTIQTSDRNEKQDIAELSDAEQRVAVAAKGLLRKFRWKDSVAEKGDDARIHFGIIAQDLQAAFEAEGLDAGDYAMFISTTWTDEETNEEKTRMGVRYSELLAFIISAI